MSYLLLIASLACALVIYFVAKRPLVSIGVFLLGTALAVYWIPSHCEKDVHTITVGVSANFPPFTSFDIKNNQIVGFDIDLINEIGKRLDKKIVLQNMRFTALLPALQLGGIQAICSGLTATPERAKHVLFTTPYLEGNALIIVSRLSEPLTTVADLHDKEVIVNEGYTADLYLSKIPGLHVRRLKSVAEAFLALDSGRAAAFVTAQNTVQSFFAKNGSADYHIAVIPDTDENASIAVSPKCPALLAEIQKALDTMMQDGSLETLKKKWKIE